MPLYEYQCEACQQTVEVLVRNQAEQPNCPLCGTDRLEKMFSVPASPAVRGGGLPVAARSEAAAQACGAPRCCGGGCQF